MLTELEGKGGRVCAAARNGELKCPLIVRPTSEDVITGNLFGTLQVINPRYWAPQLLNHAMGWPRFRQQVFRRFRISLWQNRPPYPRELLPWNEGSTQVDAVLEWENPPTTVFIEVKYLSDFTPRTANDNGSSGYPSDQLIRNIRVGLRECGWIEENRLFPVPRRDFAAVLLRPCSGHPLVASYRNEATLRKSIPQSERIANFPSAPFVGQITIADIAAGLLKQRRMCAPSERRAVDQLAEYLLYKSEQAAQGRPACQEGAGR